MCEARVGKVSVVLELLLPSNWEKMSSKRRLNYIKGLQRKNLAFVHVIRPKRRKNGKETG